MLTRLALPLALCLAALAAPSHGAPLPVPTVAYSADRTIETEAGTMTGKVYATRGMERSETTMSGMTTVMILRHDKQLGYMLMPAQHMYQQLDFAQARKQSGSQAADSVDITQVGTETIEGHSTTKYKMLMKDASGGGFIWITSDGIAIKMDLLSKNAREKTRMTVTLTNLQIGAQDPQLFEVPPDYKALPKFGGAAGFGGFDGGAPTGANAPRAANTPSGANVPSGANTPSAASATSAANAPSAAGSPNAADAAANNAAQAEQSSAAGAATKSGISALGNAARGLFHRH
jgi:hypothetical protein